MNRLNLAAGNRPLPGWVNHDRWKHSEWIDVAHDLEDFPWPWATDAFGEIFAHDILEHVQRPVKFIEELWRVSNHGANVYVHTCWAGPSPDARTVWEDPTHVRPFHENSFRYFDPVNGEWWFKTYGQFYSPARFEELRIQPEPPYNIMFELRAIKA